MRTAVVVLEDVGRSLRMQYHALSLAERGDEVDFIGFAGTPPLPAVSAHPRIHVHDLVHRAAQPWASGGTGRFVVAAVLRAARVAFALFGTLMRVPSPDVILVQNPPAVPTLGVAWVVARLRGARLAIDWHNLTHTVAAVRLGERHRAVRALARAERRWARRADLHLSASKALASWLQREYGVTAPVVYDRPAAAFSRTASSEAAALWARIAPTADLGADRLPLVVCPTSWTAADDFDLLLEALERAERSLARPVGARGASPGTPAAHPVSPAGPLLALTLTGRGDLREAFEARAARRQLTHLAVRTIWLEAEDYPAWIGMADLGLCLHQSSSGLDLPKQLADFRGAGVPVASLDYAPVLGEVLTSGHEGVTFRDPGELADLLVRLAAGGILFGSPLERTKIWLSEHPAERWDDHWPATAGRVLVSR